MAVVTEADERRDQVIVHINAALKELNVIIYKRCWGWEDYRQDYRDKLIEIQATLLRFRDEL
jgi:hypothetical protein